MAVGIQKAWSLVANNNGSADSNVGWPEGQAPGSINNAARAEMAAVKGFANQILGAKTTGGSSNAYTFTSDSVAAISTAYGAGMGFVFKANHTNSGASTLNVDGVGAKSIKKGGAQSALAANDIVSGGIYQVFYEASGDCFILTNPETGQTSGGFQTLDAMLTALAGSTSAASQYLRATGSDTLTWDSYATVLSNIGALASSSYTAADVLSKLLTVDGSSSGLDADLLDGLHGSSYRQTGKISIPIPARSMYPRETGGAQAGSFELGNCTYKTYDFDATTQEHVQFDVFMPKGWNEGTVSYQPIWTAASGSGGVVWALEAAAISDDETLNATLGNDASSTDTLGTANRQHTGPESAAITIGGSPAEGDLVLFNLRRQTGNASDTLNADARLLGIKLNITLNAPNDA